MTFQILKSSFPIPFTNDKMLNTQSFRQMKSNFWMTEILNPARIAAARISSSMVFIRMACAVTSAMIAGISFHLLPTQYLMIGRFQSPNGLSIFCICLNFILLIHLPGIIETPKAQADTGWKRYFSFWMEFRITLCSKGKYTLMKIFPCHKEKNDYERRKETSRHIKE